MILPTHNIRFAKVFTCYRLAGSHALGAPLAANAPASRARRVDLLMTARPGTPGSASNCSSFGAPSFTECCGFDPATSGAPASEYSVEDFDGALKKLADLAVAH